MHNDRVHKRGDDGRVSEVRRQRATFGNRTTDDSRCSRGKAPLKEKGVKIVKEPQKVFWGGYSSYFADPDDFLWEVAYNPYSKFDEDGNLIFE